MDGTSAAVDGPPVREWPDDADVASAPWTDRVRDLLPWAAWVASLAFAGWQVASYARRLPYVDDYPFVPWVNGRQPLSLSWLWRQSSEHRLIVTKLIEVTVGRFSGGDYSVQVWVNLAILAGLAAGSMIAVRRMRGRTAWGDAFFPLLILAPQLPSLQWGFHVHFVMNSVAAITLTLIAARFGLDVPTRWCWVGVVGLVLLWGGGAPGLAMLPGFAVWLVWSVLRRRRADRTQGIVLLAATAVVGVMFVGYFIGWHGVPSRTPTPVQILTTTLHAATAPGGNAMYDWWPLSGLAVGGALALTVGLVVVRLANRATRTRNHSVAIALAAAGGAVLALLVAIGYGRGTKPFTIGLEQHYSDAVLPVLVWAYLVWDRLCRGRLRVTVGVVLALAALASTWMNTSDTLVRYREIHDQQVAFIDDFCAGASPARLTRRYYSPLLFLDDWDTTLYGAEAVPEGIRVLSRRWNGTFCP